MNRKHLDTLLFIAVLLLIAFALAGCRSHKAITDESETASLTDTTRAERDSLTKSESVTDTTKTATKTEHSAVIEFVDGGGTVSIDSTGNVTLTGVKSIKGDLKAAKTEEKGLSAAKTETGVHSSKANGIKADTAKARHQEKEVKTESPKWYQGLLAKIGGLCCIAALLYVLFLCLKKKI